MEVDWLHCQLGVGDESAGPVWCLAEKYLVRIGTSVETAAQIQWVERLQIPHILEESVLSAVRDRAQGHKTLIKVI